MHRSTAARGRLWTACAVVVEQLESRQLLSTVPTGYSESPVASGLNSPMSMEFAPDGRLFVTEQAGTIRIIKNGSLLDTPALTKSVVSDGERGMLSVAFDPNFATNNFIYVCYTTATPTIHNRISRFTMTGDIINAASEQILFELDTQTAQFHMGGDMHFGNDGKLYITTGENFDETNAQQLTNLKGKLLRINADGSIPEDNPFYNTLTGNNRAIYAYGLRNPFTFDVQTTTGKIFINDVGGGNWEEINQAVAGGNYGWPNAEGMSSNPAYVNPLFAYPHEGPLGTSGYAITGGHFYNPVTAEFPAEMIGKYFFTDYVNSWIRVFDPATGQATPFASDVPGAVDLEISPDGQLYYLNRGSGGATGGVFRVRYLAAPTIVTQPQSQNVQPGQPVTFSVTATGIGPLTYQWQRNGVNIAGATASSYTITSAGVVDNGAKYRVIVTDALGNATLTGGAAWTAGPTGQGSAIQFDGVNDSVQSGLDLSQWLGGTSTLTAWIKTTQTGTIFYESPGITGVEQSQGDNDIMWGWLDDQGKIGIHPGNALGGISAAPVNNGQWHHVAFTRNATTGVIQVYVDGTLSGSASSAVGLKTTPFFGIGVIDDTGGTPAFFQGTLDDIRIYNRVLTAAELANAASLPTSGLVTHYAFNEGQGGTALNSIPAGHSTTSAEATLTVASGTAPVPTILTPTVDSLYTAGEAISFSGSATDPDDGALPASAFTWRIDLHHDTHSHPAMADLTGVTSGTFTIPTNVETSDNVWYRIYLTVKDSSGQSVTTFRDIFPRKATLTVTSNLPGATLTLDGSPVTGPKTFVGVAGVERSIGAPATQTISGITYTFTGWSDGGAATHTISTPLVNTTYTANYAAVGTTFLSDMTPAATPVNGWGPMEKDKSNGEEAAGDGKTLTLNGTTYTKGLGVHAGSDITYNLGGAFGTFLADVGIDDESGTLGSVVFQVYVDGVLAHGSGVMTGATATKQFSVNVAGKNTLRLVVSDGGDNNWDDHADWADARLTSAAPNTDPVATIVTPVLNSTYNAGTTLSFSGTGSDVEDGTLGAAAFTWKVELVHDDHSHLVYTTAGATSGSYAIPSTGETSANVFYRVSLTVIDSGGKSHTVTRDVTPNTVTVTLASNVAGIPLTVDGVAATSFVGVTGIQRTIAAPATVTISGTTYNFTGWSDAGAASHAISTPAVNTTYTATYTAVAPNTPPVPTITTPVVSAKYIAGQAINFSGDATDAEDGTLAAAAFAWTVDFYKDGVLVNTVATASGAKSGSYTPPTNGETSANVFYRISLTVTDAAGTAVTVTRDVLPTTVTLTFASSPVGVPFTLDGTAVAGPVVSVVGKIRTIAAPATAVIGGAAYNFAGWSDAGAATHTIATPSANTTYTATYTAVPVGSTPVYLSDLTPVGTPVNGWGAYEKDKSNGEQGAADGGTITLAGVTYAKGLGVHANSDLTFNLGGQYATFLSDIGLDDEVGSLGNATFVVYLDGVQAYTSGAMTGSTATKSVNLNVTGKQTLRLVVTAGANDWDDHADWANARLIPAAGALPAGWTSGNVGTVGATGSAGHVGGNYVIAGAGAGITGTADAFRYTYQQLGGDFMITARVTSLSAGAMAGVMLRTSLSANSAQASLLMNSASGFVWSRRTSTGGSTTNTTSSTSGYPYYVRIQRVGNTITTFRSTNGTAWTQVGTQSITLGTSVYVGLAVTSKISATTATAVFDNVAITAL